MAAATQGPEVRRPTATHGGGAIWPRAEQLAPLTGIAPFILGLAGLVVWEGPADRPEWDAPRGVILSYFGDRDTVILGGFLLVLAALFFLGFASWLRVILRRAEEGAGALSTLAYGGGLVAAASMLAMPASNIFGALYASELSPQGAQTFYFFGDVFLYPAAMGAAVLVGSTALAVLRTGALARWLAWPSLLLALWLLIPPLGSAAGTPENPAWWTGLAALPLVLLWVALTSLVFLFEPGDREREDEP
jgi:hypothetical protein